MKNIAKTTSPNKQTQSLSDLLLLTDKRKKELEKLNAKIDEGRRLVGEHLVPFEFEYNALLRQYILALGTWLANTKLKDGERAILANVINDAVTIYASYTPNDAEIETVRLTINSLQHQTSHTAPTNDDDVDYSERYKNHHKKKHPPKAQPKAEETAIDEKQIKTIAKKIFNDLVKTYHPDREQDETLRIEKTELMKTITTTYAENDTVGLMKLHQSLMTDDNKLAFDHLPPDQIPNYTNLLQKQADGLQQQINQLKNSPVTQTLFYFVDANPIMQQHKLTHEAQRLSARNAQLSDDIASTNLEHKAFVRFLKAKNNVI